MTIIKDICMETSSWTMPRWDCNHQWINDGPATQTWTSADTMNDPPEKGCVIHQKQKCYLCGGEQWLITGEEV